MLWTTACSCGIDPSLKRLLIISHWWWANLRANMRSNMWMNMRTGIWGWIWGRIWGQIWGHEYENECERMKMKMATILMTTKMTLVPPWKCDNILWWKWLLTLSQFHQCRWWWIVMCCRTSSGNDLLVFALINNLRQYGRFLRWSNDDKVSCPCKFASSTDDDWMLIHRQMSANYNFCQFSIGL